MDQQKIQVERLFRDLQMIIGELQPETAQFVAALQTPDALRDIVPQLLTDGSLAPDLVGRAIAKKLRRDFLTAEDMAIQEVEVVQQGPNGVLLYRDKAVMVNPYDDDMVRRLQRQVETDQIKFEHYAVMPADIFQDPRFSAKAQVSGGSSSKAISQNHEEGTKDEMEQLIKEIIQSAYDLRASDIHIAGGATKADVRIRVDGRLRPFRTFSMAKYKKFENVLHEKTGKSISDPSRSFDGDFSMTLGNDASVNIRVGSIPHQVARKTWRKITLRLLGMGGGFNDIKELGLANKNQEMLYSVVRRPKGIFIVTGPTSSGKSTLLGTVMQTSQRFSPTKSHYTLEHPVETEYKHFYQIPIEGKLTFEEALESAMRLDPDVIMVGEIRSKATAELAIQAALTGHLVFATLHTNDAYGVLGRLRFYGIADSFLSDTLIGASGQRLIPKLCRECGTKKPFREVRERLKGAYPLLKEITSRWIADDEEVGVRHQDGCRFCNNSGLLGRVATYEMFLSSLPVREEILSGRTGMQIRNKQFKEEKFRPMWVDGIELLKKGAVCFEELFSVLDESELQDLLEIGQADLSAN